jgi:hypothetical protein
MATDIRAFPQPAHSWDVTVATATTWKDYPFNINILPGTAPETGQFGKITPTLSIF